MFIVDTNVVSDLRRPEKAAPSLVEWAKAQDPSTIYLSVISIWELEYGVLLKTHADAQQGKILREWFETKVLPTYGGRILPVCLDAVRACAPLHIPNKRPERDAFIAATAFVHNMTIVTRNEKDFAGMNCALYNPWKVV